MLTRSQRLAAVRDVEYHRYVMFGRGDALRARQLARELLPHETQATLSWPQAAVIRRCERAIAERSGEVIVVRQSRQTGKNEEEAMIEARALVVFRGMPGSIYVRTAPTWKPQIINSKIRLEKHLRACPLVGGRWTSREGYIYESNGASIHFLSGGPQANVVGDTASIALSVDEAHKIDAGKFDEDLAPFTAYTNAPTFMFGVAADKQDLLYEYRGKADGTDCLLEFPASVFCELSPAYARHYEKRLFYLGHGHPVIATQYDLVDIDAVGAYLSATQRAALFSGDHPRLEAPRDGTSYYLVADLGGQSEEQAPDDVIREEQPGRDSTFWWVIEVDHRESDEPYALVRVVNGGCWTGRDHMACVPDIKRIVDHWRIVGGAIDARGVGEAVAMAVHSAYPQIEAYKASNETVSADCYDLLARINVGRVRFWKADPAADDTLREMQAQARHTRYEIRGHELMRLRKPTGAGSTDKHIDGMKALTYMRRALDQINSGLLSYIRAEKRKAQEPAAPVVAATEPTDPALVEWLREASGNGGSTNV